MRTALVVGGLPIANQLHRLRSGVQVGTHIVCSTRYHGARLFAPVNTTDDWNQPVRMVQYALSLI